MTSKRDADGRKLVIPGDQRLVDVLLRQGGHLPSGVSTSPAVSPSRQNGGLVHGRYLDVDQKMLLLIEWDQTHDLGFTETELRLAEKQFYQRSRKLGWSEGRADPSVDLVAVPYVANANAEFESWLQMLGAVFEKVRLSHQVAKARQEKRLSAVDHPGRCIRIEAVRFDRQRRNVLIRGFQNMRWASSGVLAAVVCDPSCIRRLSVPCIWLPGYRFTGMHNGQSAEFYPLLSLDKSRDILHVEAGDLNRDSMRGVITPVLD